MPFIIHMSQLVHSKRDDGGGWGGGEHSLLQYLRQKGIEHGGSAQVRE